MAQIINIHGKLATLNEHDNTNRTSRFAGAALKKKMNELVASQAPALGINSPMLVHFTWRYSGRHDFDNIAFAKKYVLDGLQHAGTIVNDNQKFVRGFSDSFKKVNPGDEGVMVIIEELDAE